MSGSTTELSLQTAVDSDDNADYLTIALANSLRTIDGLFNNVTGHNHGGAHQGGAISASAIPAGTITSTMIADGTIQAIDLANGSVTNPKIADGAVTGAKIAAGDLTLPAGLILNSNLTMNVGSGSLGFFFGDASHYLQARPAGQTDVLAWSHDFSVTRNLSVGGTATITGNASVTGGTLFIKTTGNSVSSDGTNLFITPSLNLYLRPGAGGGVFLDTGNGNLTVNNDVQCASISMLKGANQVIYWRDGSHYMQYAPAGDTNMLQWTHNLKASGVVYAGNQIVSQGAGCSGNGAYINTASSRTLKHAIQTLQGCLAQVMAVRAVSFEYNTPLLEEPGVSWDSTRLGFIAEEVRDVVPQAAGTLNDNPEVARGLLSEALLSVLWGAVRELAAQVQELKGQPA